MHHQLCTVQCDLNSARASPSPFLPRSIKNIMEKGLTRSALPYDYACFADGTQFEYEIYFP